MKVLRKFLLSLMIVVMAAGCFAGCKIKVGITRTAPDKSQYELGIMVHQGEYGRVWMDTLATKYEEEMAAAGTPVRIKVFEGKTDAVTNALTNKSTDVDLFYTQKVEWKTQSVHDGGSLEPLDDLLEREVEDGVLLKDRIDADLLSTSIYNNHYYKLPWTNGVGGLVYNNKMFKQKGWAIPTVYSNPANPSCDPTKGDVGLKELCVIIYDAGIKPFAWSEESYYWDYVVFDWWMQLLGEEKLQEYVALESSDPFDPVQNPEREQALKAWYDLVGNKDYSIANASGTNYSSAQMAFIGGAAAMMPNAQWLQSGMESVMDTTKCELGLMPTPKMNGAKGDYSFSVGSGDSILVAKHAPGKELAKDFLVWMAKKENIKTFTDETRGAILAMDYTDIKLDDDALLFAKDVMKIHKTSKRFNLLSNSLKAFNGELNLEWPGAASQPYSTLYGSDPSSVNIPQMLINNYENVKRGWDNL